LIAQGGMKAQTGPTPTTLDPAFDLNVKTRYFISKQFSAFVALNNILSNKYPLYLGYPARGFQVLAGVSWSF
jgi:outer membrane receptor protein involved in Fe transport